MGNSINNIHVHVYVKKDRNCCDMFTTFYVSDSKSLYTLIHDVAVHIIKQNSFFISLEYLITFWGFLSGKVLIGIWD